MRSLEDVLEQATSRNAFEVVIESGQPVVMTTPQGPLSLDGVFDEGELIEALTGVLDAEQQVELAVGNLIEFQMTAGSGRWTLVTEPGAEGVMVRGRLQQAPTAPPPSASGGFELPPLEPFTPGVDDAPPPMGGPSIAPGPDAKPTVRDMGFGIPDPPGMHAPAQTGEFDVDVTGDAGAPPLGGEEALSQTLYNPGGPAPMDTPAGPSIDDLDLGGPEPPPPGAGTLYSNQGPAPVPQMGEAEPLDPANAEELGFGGPDAETSQAGATLHLGSNPARPDAAAEMGVPDDDDEASFANLDLDAGASAAPPASTPAVAVAAAAAVGGLEEHALMLGPGTLCFVHGTGVAESLAAAIGGPVYVVDDSATGTRTMRTAFEESPAEATAVLLTEDPSKRLGWLLRRLEEGWRVLIETRAHTPEGARRILLGVEAGDQAVAWLDEQEIHWLLPAGDGWELK